ncbi:MAG: DUF1254 domain-containing protein [Planctomycetota bacterium]
MLRSLSWSALLAAPMFGACQSSDAPAPRLAPPAMEMTTEVPDGIATPDRLETRIGTLTAFDGVPDRASAEVVYDHLDFHHGVQAFLSGIQIASMSAMRKGLLEFGPANTTAVVYEDLMDSKALWLTPNTTSVYMASWLQMTDEPWVIETPPDVLGIIDDHWFKYVGDFGRLGPDRAQGGKFLLLPPGYEGDVPDGYFVLRTNTYGHWVIWRGFQVDGSTRPAVDATKERFRMYALSDREDPPAMTFVNASGVFSNTIHSMDFAIWEEIDSVVQAEPSDGQNPEILGALAAIGIQKGKPFEPDARMKRILTEAAEVGAMTVRTIMSQPRDEGFFLFPGKSVSWTNPFVGGSHEFLAGGAQLLDARAAFHFYATGITPAMAAKIIGKGSKYASAYLDADGNPFDGSKTYRIHVPPNVPAKDFWSFTLYDNQTRAMLQTDQRFPGIDNNKPGMVRNEDGSYDVYVGPEPPEGMENNWIQSVPDKGWNTLFRLYGPLEPWFDGEWRPGDPELVE